MASFLRRSNSPPVPLKRAQRCEPATLLECARACRAWRDLLRGCRGIWASSFAHTWRLSGALRTSTEVPRSVAFFLKPPPFVRRHALLQGDTLPALALRYGTSSAALKMMNSLGSEHAINSRSVIYVPVPVDSVCGALCAAIFDGNAQREVAIVVQGEEELKAAVVSENAGSTRPRRLLVLLPLSCASTAELSPTFPFSPAVALLARSQGEAHASRRRAQDRAASRLNEQLRRALNTDEATVSFYLASKGGDVKEAVRSAMEDAEWERALLCRASHDAAG